MKSSKKLVTMIFVGLIVLIFSASAIFAEQFTVTIKGAKQGNFKGDYNAAAGQKAKITGYAYWHEISADSSNVATGGGSGVVTHNPITFVKKWGPSTPQIMQALTSHEMLSEVVFEFTKPDAAGVDTVYFRVKLTNANITKVRQVTANALGAEYPLLFPDTTAFRKAINSNMELELVSFSYQKIEWTSVDGATVATDD